MEETVCSSYACRESSECLLGKLFFTFITRNGANTFVGRIAILWQLKTSWRSSLTTNDADRNSVIGGTTLFQLHVDVELYTYAYCPIAWNSASHP